MIPRTHSLSSPQSTSWNYDRIKQLARETGRRVGDLIVLAPMNDPFYFGQPAQIVNGRWFADLYHQHNFTHGVHLRRVHYRLVTLPEAALMPDGQPYLNTERCWDFLSTASKAARYLGMVDLGDFVDKRNPAPHTFTNWTEDQRSIWADSALDFDGVTLPEFPDTPRLTTEWNWPNNQRYHLEIWCEKSTVDDVLLPVCQRYRANLVTGVGELSISAVHDLIRRLRPDTPCRIAYVSDFDPAGQSMPTAIARKIQWQLEQYHIDADVILQPIVLSHAQCLHYQLPRTPLKESEQRAAKFEQRFGEGATELDAMEAIVPGELDRTVRSWADQYFDRTLSDRTEARRQELLAALGDLTDDVLGNHADDIGQLRAEYDALRQEVAGRLASLNRRIQHKWQAISAELDAVAPDVGAYELPTAPAVIEQADVLYDSQRDYLEQLTWFKQFQGRADDDN